MTKESSNSGGGSSTANKPSFLTVFNISVMVFVLPTKSVSWTDVFFPVFASVYVYVMCRVVYPTRASNPNPPVDSWNFPMARFVPRYLLLAAVIGLLLPLLQIVIAFVGGDQTTLRESAPHLFILCAQVLTENLTTSLALPIKGLIPALYNSYRLITLYTWAIAVFSRDVSGDPSFASTAWGVFGRSVVVSNVLLWHFNLWCFLLPIYVPWTLRTHYTGENTPRETHVD